MLWVKANAQILRLGNTIPWLKLKGFGGNLSKR